MELPNFRHKQLSGNRYTGKTPHHELKHEINQISLISGKELSSLKVCYYYDRYLCNKFTTTDVNVIVA